MKSYPFELQADTSTTFLGTTCSVLTCKCMYDLSREAETDCSWLTLDGWMDAWMDGCMDGCICHIFAMEERRSASMKWHQADSFKNEHHKGLKNVSLSIHPCLIGTFMNFVISYNKNTYLNVQITTEKDFKNICSCIVRKPIKNRPAQYMMDCRIRQKIIWRKK